ncbi:MAG: hypothetical protein KDJ19_00780 [Hyphomicrobiaceae bacterium]|nr:hypothetical protein [Hyphomicrobiaceae bacterium]MCC0024643.1 hypothetical protein [Hyphomicrobiaceae bacterium]
MGNWILDQLLSALGAAWAGLLGAVGLVLPGFTEIAFLPPASWLVLGLAGAFLFLWGWFRSPVIAAITVGSIGLWFVFRGRGPQLKKYAVGLQASTPPTPRPTLLQRLRERLKR